MTVTVSVDEPAERNDVWKVAFALRAFNADAGLSAEQRPLHAFARDASGAVVGGLNGSTAHGWLFVADLWVADEARGQGLGRRLLDAAEAAAARRGCVGAWVDTFDLQAPGFYERCGYAVFGTLADCPPGHARVFLSKRF